MPVPKRIVVVDDDTKVRQLIEYRLRPPEFEFFGFSDGRDALMNLHRIKPDLIVSDIMMPDMDGRLFFKVVKRSADLKAVPFVFVSAVRADADVMAALEAGANAFFVKPFPISQLVAKIRADLGMETPPGETVATASTAPGVTPLPGEATERLATPPPAEVPAAASAVPSAIADDFHVEPPGDGDAEEAMAESSRDDFFDMLLTTPAPGDDLPARTAGVLRGDGGHGSLEGRSSTIDVRGRRVYIRTEVRGLPTFAVVTGLTLGDKAVARIETAWQHPLDRVEDRALVRRQIDLQHRQAVGMVEDLVVETPPRQVLWGSQERSVDASILCRGMNVLSEQLLPLIEPPALIALLRQTLAATSQIRRVLHGFQVRQDGAVWCSRESGRVPHDAVAAVAAWAAELLQEAGRSSAGARGLALRQLTRPVAQELERIGFYRVFEELTRFQSAAGRQSSGVRVSFIPHRPEAAPGAHEQRRLAFPAPVGESRARGEDEGGEPPPRRDD